MFEICDNYNRALHDCHWPHKRGGKNTQGDLGCHHDFVMACIMQNTMNAYFTINELNIKTASFEKIMIELALELYIYSCSL